MIKEILIDTNIILDFALERENYFSNAEKILKLAYDKAIVAFITAPTVCNIYYIARKQTGRDKALEFIKNILSFLEIANIDKQAILNALDSDFKDFEDALQNNAAQDMDIPIIITRNEIDFKKSKLIIYSPEQFIEVFLKEQNAVNK
jgi:predicted nucleic acid-binding protein